MGTQAGQGVSLAVACLSICLLRCELVGHGCSDCDKTFSGGKKWANEHGGPFSISQKGKVKIKKSVGVND